MPSLLLDAYAAQLHRLTAEEALQAAERTAVGSGVLRRGVGRQITAAWQRQVGRQGPVLRPRSREAYEAHMAMAGIPVKRQPKAADG